MHAAHAHHAGSGDERFLELLVMATPGALSKLQQGSPAQLADTFRKWFCARLFRRTKATKHSEGDKYRSLWSAAGPSTMPVRSSLPLRWRNAPVEVWEVSRGHPQRRQFRGRAPAAFEVVPAIAEISLTG
ncbi:hypothetical protein BKP42_52600 [Rhodococcus erythropolis]|nr:hypothetical protein BKP42_52600 [Rhodococcus erythropolis]